MSEQNSPRLTYLITGLQYGGANTGMARLLSGLECEEFDIAVIAIADTPPDVVTMLPDHVEVQHMKIDSKISFFKLRHLVDTIKDTDILICSLFHATAIGLPLGLLLRVPQILVWQHSTSYQNPIRSGYYQIAYRMADQVLADSSAVKSMLVDSIKIPEQKVLTLPIAGIDTDQYRSFEIESFKGDTTISTIGRLAAEKGYDDLIQCAQELGANFQFYIAGDGQKRVQLEANAPDNVTFCGEIPNDQIPKFLNKSDIYFQPSKWEGLCMTVIEAMACELPVVASSVGGITESVVPEETGYLCEPGEIDCFSCRLEQLAKNPTLRDKMGAAGRERVISRYSQAELANQFREAVKQTKTV